MNTLQIALRQRDAAAVKRFHVKRTLRQQTVGEHTFGVLLLVHMVMPENYNVGDMLIFLKAVTFHDLPELVTGDIPAPVKRRSPALAEELERLERTADGLYLGVPLSKEERVMLKWADTTEMILWCLEERELGNRNLDRTISRGLAYIHELGPLPWLPAITFTQQLMDYAATSGIVVMVGQELEHNT